MNASSLLIRYQLFQYQVLICTKIVCTKLPVRTPIYVWKVSTVRTSLQLESLLDVVDQELFRTIPRNDISEVEEDVCENIIRMAPQAIASGDSLGVDKVQFNIIISDLFEDGGRKYLVTHNKRDVLTKFIPK
jgi:hypothetical protein